MPPRRVGERGIASHTRWSLNAIWNWRKIRRCSPQCKRRTTIWEIARASSDLRPTPIFRFPWASRPLRSGPEELQAERTHCRSGTIAKGSPEGPGAEPASNWGCGRSRSAAPTGHGAPASPGFAGVGGFHAGGGFHGLGGATGVHIGAPASPSSGSSSIRRRDSRWCGTRWCRRSRS